MSPNGHVTTRVGRVQVPVKGQHPSLGIFVGGARGKQEAGLFFFWTAVLKRPYVDGQRVCIARARALLPPGERFERMSRERRTARSVAQRRGNDAWWTRILRRGEGIAYIRPATRREATRWLATHGPDAQHLTWFLVGAPRPTPPAPAPPSPPPPERDTTVREQDLAPSPGFYTWVRSASRGDWIKFLRALWAGQVPPGTREYEAPGRLR